MQSCFCLHCVKRIDGSMVTQMIQVLFSSEPILLINNFHFICCSVMQFMPISKDFHSEIFQNRDDYVLGDVLLLLRCANGFLSVLKTDNSTEFGAKQLHADTLYVTFHAE